MKNHEVQQGECIGSIAFENGFFPDTIWQDDSNKVLRDKRKDMNSLAPGDVVVIPDRKPKGVSVATDARHTFKLKGVPSKISIRLLLGGEPRKDEPYEIEVAGRTETGRTDQNGVVRFNVPPDAKEGRLIVGDGELRSEYLLNLGHLDPAGEISGVQARLNNLGYDCGPVTGKLDSRTVLALALFQAANGLKANGRLDTATQDALRAAHDGDE